MGCFSVWKNRRAGGERPLLPPSQPLCLIYENKPTVLPDPVQVETELSGALHRSAPPSLNYDIHYPTCTTPSPLASIAQSASTTFANVAKKEPSDGGRSKHQAESNACAILCRTIFPSHERRQPFVPGSWNSGPMFGSFSHSGPIFTSASEANFYSWRKPFPANPLPLPSPHDPWLRTPASSSPSCSTAESFHVDYSGSLIGSISMHAEPLPNPEKVTKLWRLRSFTWEELSSRCSGFSSKCLIGETGSGAIYKSWTNKGCDPKQKEITVFRLKQSFEDEEGFIAHVTSLAQARDSHLCRFVGYSLGNISSPAGDIIAAKSKLLVFRRLGNGSLEKHLHGQEDRPTLDWTTRIRIALDAARGLMELQKKFPDKAMYLDFRPLYIELDRNFRGKLTGYGSTRGYVSEHLAKTNPMILKYLAPETSERGELTVQSNVWSYGVVLLDLMTGGQINGESLAAEWSTHVLQDGTKLFQALDPQLRGCYSSKHVKILSNLMLQCLQKDPYHRPNIERVVEVLRSVVDQHIPTPKRLIKHHSASVLEDSANKCISLKQALHQHMNAEDDPSSFSLTSKMQMQGQLRGRSFSDWSLSSRSLWSCSSSFAMERRQQQHCSAFSKMEAQQTG